MPKTVKDDWLTAALAASSDSSRQVWRSGGGLTQLGRDSVMSASTQAPVVALRACAHHPRTWPRPSGAAADWLPAVYEPFRLWLTVEYSEEAAVDPTKLLSDVSELSKDPALRQLGQALKSRLAIVAYRSTNQAGSAVSPPSMVVFDHAVATTKRLTAEKYAEILNAQAKPLAGGDPPRKLVNASVNDSFQAWSRQHLTPQVAIVDLDMVLRFAPNADGPARFVLLELKRQTKSLQQAASWKPYIDDTPNFMVTRSMTRLQDSDGPSVADVTVNYYGRADASPYACWVHLLGSLSRTEIAGMRHHVQGMSPEACAQGLLDCINRLIGRPFASRNHLRS